MDSDESMKVSKMGIAWYRREDYDRLRRIFSDGANLPQHYDDWLKLAEKLAERLKNQGQAFQRVYIDPDTFPDWCARTGSILIPKLALALALWRCFLSHPQRMRK
jgi:hypothetical protein